MRGKGITAKESPGKGLSRVEHGLWISDGRVIDYGYDSVSRQTTETWYDDVTDADAEQNVRKTYSTQYDPAGRVATIGDGDYDFEYTWSIFGNLTSTTQDLTGLADDVAFSYGYDVFGRKTGVAASIGSTDDYVNTYSYDKFGRITQITQDGVRGVEPRSRQEAGPFLVETSRRTSSQSAQMALLSSRSKGSEFA